MISSNKSDSQIIPHSLRLYDTHGSPLFYNTSVQKISRERMEELVKSPWFKKTFQEHLFRDQQPEVKARVILENDRVIVIPEGQQPIIARISKGWYHHNPSIEAHVQQTLQEVKEAYQKYETRYRSVCLLPYVIQPECIECNEHLKRAEDLRAELRKLRSRKPPFFRETHLRKVSADFVNSRVSEQIPAAAHSLRKQSPPITQKEYRPYSLENTRSPIRPQSAANRSKAPPCPHRENLRTLPVTASEPPT